MKLRKLDIPYAMPKLLLRLHLRVALSLTNTVITMAITASKKAVNLSLLIKLKILSL